MKTVIITGVTGQDGSLMADYLLQNTDFFVYGAHRRLSVPNHGNIEHLKNNSRFSTIDLDITDTENINQVIREIKPDYFINFAANSFVGNSWKMPVNHMQTNCMGVLFCLEAIRNYSPETRFYNAGSSEQFGDVIYSPQDINHPFRPRSPYGAAKCAAHHLVKVYRDSYNIYAVQGILFNHEGVRRGEEFVTRKITKGVARINSSICDEKPFEPIKLGNLSATRDWSDSEDFVEAVWLMLNKEEPKDYLLSSNETHTIREFVEKAFLAAGIEGAWIGEGLNEKFIVPNWVHDISGVKSSVLVEIDPVFFRPCEVQSLFGNSDTARKELNWNPKVSFDQLVKKMVMWDINNS